VNDMDGIYGKGTQPQTKPTPVRLLWVRGIPDGAVTLAGVAMVSGIAALDWVTGPLVSLALFYVFAVMAVAWCGKPRHGALVAVLASVQSLAAHTASDGGSLKVAAWNAAARLVVLLTVSGLLASLRSSIAHQRLAATIDPLTGALNRRAFEVAAERERLRAERRGDPISVAYVDLDGFKAVNDRHGHQTGDRILEDFASRVVQSIRGTDLFCRIGGDEFVLLLPDTGAREAAAVLQRARTTLAGDYGVGERVTASVGIATFRIVPTTGDAMVDAADSLMYRAKDKGRDRIVGAVVAGPWLRWTPPRRDPILSVDTVAIDVEILPAESA